MVLVRTTDSAIRRSTTPYHLGFMSPNRPARHHFAFMRQHWWWKLLELLGKIDVCTEYGPPKIINVYSVKMVKMKRGCICPCTAPLQRVVVGLFLGYKFMGNNFKKKSSWATRSIHHTRILWKRISLFFLYGDNSNNAHGVEWTSRYDLIFNQQFPSVRSVKAKSFSRRPRWQVEGRPQRPLQRDSFVKLPFVVFSGSNVHLNAKW